MARLRARILALTLIVICAGCGRTPERRIHDAVVRGDAAEVNALLKKDPGLADSRDKLGWSLLHWAARSGKTRAAEALIVGGSEVDAQNDKAGTPLHMAVYSGHKDVAQALLEAGADVNAIIAENGRTPLDLAAYFGRRDMADLLLAKGAKVNARNGAGCTPLHTAVLGDHIELVRFLLQRGADPNAADREPGMTPLHWAAGQGSIEIAEALLANGAGVNATDSNGYTPLHVAATEGRVEVAKMLLRKGAEKNSRTTREVKTPTATYPAGTTPQQAAVIASKKDVADLLGGK